ncbi:unnamed protein product [Linum tenue]|uniref:Uncharacterized protein n=1 Tax=Linum tenue TaxID=586396 RepID=A0AAV0PMT3_9ROSI|nr:unnamed protein product [Linum tenue]
MSVERRLEYGFGGYRVPVVPRAARSYRGRGLTRKKGDKEGEIRAFEILASVAGKILQDGEVSSAACNGDEETELSKPDSSVCGGKTDPSGSETGLNQGYPFHDFLSPPQATSSSHKGSSTSSDHLEKKIHEDAADDNLSPKGWEMYQGQRESLVAQVKPDEVECKVKSAESGTSPPVQVDFEDKMEIDMNIPARASPENNNVKPSSSLFKNCIGGLGCFSGRSAETKVEVTRDDDDENASGCSQDVQSYKQQHISCNGVQKPRNSSSASVLKHWRVTAANSKVGGFFRTDGKASTTKATYNNSGKSSSNNQQKTQKVIPFKKRKFFACDGASVCDDLFTSPNKRTNDDNSCGSASGTSSSVSGQHTPPNSRDCNVKFSIKSFKVPELFIEIPATATVGSLKRTVMEAVTAILGDGLHVGILVQGKKVRDDNKTLLQTGISQDDKHHGLGFILEPRQHVQIASSSPPSCAQTPSFLISRSPAAASSRHTSLKLQAGGSSGVSPIVSTDMGFVGRSGGGSGDSGRAIVPLVDERASVPESKALVTVPSIRMEAMAMVPFHRKSGQPELGQRRMRRPFSVSEVEALVQAVEKLGTGRWRDVKLRAFDNVHHRTYVDLKDKWKTLVHTARISPQQRRGEPVPQELLDRVLAAHAYWSQQQAKQQAKATS